MSLIKIIENNQSYQEESHNVLKFAFETTEELALVCDLEKNQNIVLSFVACVNDVVAGVIYFSPMHCDDKIVGCTLAPLAVLPKYQNQGVGKELINHSIALLRANSPYDFISVLGDPNYYKKFNFVEGSNFNLNCPFNVPKEYFLVYPLLPLSLYPDNKLSYAKEFDRFL